VYLQSKTLPNKYAYIKRALPEDSYLKTDNKGEKIDTSISSQLALDSKLALLLYKHKNHDKMSITVQFGLSFHVTPVSAIKLQLFSASSRS